MDKIRSAAKRFVDAARTKARETAAAEHVQIAIRDKTSNDRYGFSVETLDKIIVQGAAPWDIKPGILARARKYARDGTPYVDVPVHLNRQKNAPEQSSVLAAWGDRGLRFLAAGRAGAASGPVLFRRISLRTPSWAWIHPGFGGEARSNPRFFGTSYGPHVPGGAERSDRDLGFSDGPPVEDNQKRLAAKLKEAVRRLAKEGRR